MAVTIRRATSKDLTNLVTTGKEFFDSTSMPSEGIQWSAQDALQMGAYLLNQGIVQVAYDGDELVGFILMIVGPIPFTKSAMAATELAFYVRPAYRDEGVGRKLLRQAENVAKQLGIRKINMLHLGDSESAKNEQFYTDNGFRPTEVTFTKDL